MKFEVCYTSSNSNETPTIADWGKNNLICYGACNSVMIYDPKYGNGGKVIQTLVGHTKRVNSVKWLAGDDTKLETEVISGSTDSTVKVWSFTDSNIKCKTLEGHKSNVNIVTGMYKDNNKTSAVIISVSMDSTIKIWTRITTEDEFVLNQSIDFGYHIGISISLTFIPQCKNMLLACALDNSKVNIYKESEEKQFYFETAACLKGHEDWVRGLAFTKDKSDLLLASCSQDESIRLWRITTKLLLKDDSSQNKNLQQIRTHSQNFFIYMESVLLGHDGWIYSLCWNPKKPQLLSASFDKTMIIWELDENIGLWVEKIRVGEVGGNTLGFYGGLFSPTGDNILAHSYHGAFHIWEHQKQFDEWKPCVTVGGHFSEVIDCAWEPKGEFLFTCSADQTTRIHAPWTGKGKTLTWHEIARPQVHGYDISGLAVISRYKYASSAEEKVIRVFEAPANFVENFRRLCHIENDSEGSAILQGENQSPKGASVPSLGLSNKAVFSEDNKEQAAAVDKRNNYPEESHFVATILIEPPTEETLLQNTLWPETQKLYGHGYEVYCLAASPDQRFLASACRSTKPEHAAVLIWDTSTWQQLQKLKSHNLTVVQLQFSPDSCHLLSVSRDRRWSLFSLRETIEDSTEEISEEDSKNCEDSQENCEEVKKDIGPFKLVATTNKETGIHTRIIWTCSWSHDSKYFATGSRDGQLIVWTICRGKPKTTVLGECEMVLKPLKFKDESVTAVAFAPALIQENYLVAVGLESGIIKLFLWNSTQPKEVLSINQSAAHTLTVKKLAFRPVFGKTGAENNEEKVLQLASCSSDHSVKVYNIYV